VLRRSVPELQYPLSVLVLGMVDRSTEEGRQLSRQVRCFRRSDESGSHFNWTCITRHYVPGSLADGNPDAEPGTK
jgi:hypothetical protein